MSVLAPRAVLVHRRSELTELLERHGTRGQVEFFLRTRGRTLGEVDERHEEQQVAHQAVSAAVPVHWRRGAVERGDLARFLFAPGDVVVVVGQDGLVANVAKYLETQPVLGVAPGRPGVLVRHDVRAAVARLRAPELGAIQERTMVQARTDDGQLLRALNEVYVGHASHQSARYALQVPGARIQAQSSSGVLVSSGTGATGWCASVLAAHGSAMVPPTPTEPRLTWLVREAWPSPSTGTSLVEGELAVGQELSVHSRCDRLVVFGDGIEADFVELGWGQTVTVSTAPQRLRLII